MLSAPSENPRSSCALCSRAIRMARSARGQHSSKRPACARIHAAIRSALINGLKPINSGERKTVTGPVRGYQIGDASATLEIANENSYCSRHVRPYPYYTLWGPAEQLTCVREESGEVVRRYEKD